MSDKQGEEAELPESEVGEARPVGAEQAEASPPVPAEADPRRSILVFVGVSLAIALVVLLGLRFAVGVDFDSPTLALALACMAMIWALRAMWSIVIALSRPTAETLIVEGDLGAEFSTQSDLRDEKRRVLRAIKELEFDHAMGKLSEEDFRAVGDRYRMRAIEVMRALDGSREIHPQLREHLAAVGVTLEEQGS